jgi:hypothetical protein
MDKDGDLDLLVTDGAGVKYYVNDGTGLFLEVSAGAGLVGSTLSEGAALADIDDDGDIDFYVARGQFSPNTFFLNNGNMYNYLGVKLRGTRSTRDAIGARVTVFVNGRTMVREVSGGSGLYSMNDRTQYFGLSQEMVVDQLTIEWPSGRTQTFTNIAADQVLEITEQGFPHHRIALPL